MSVPPIPEGYHTVTPYLIVKGAARAIEFYEKAFGAKEVLRMPGPGGKGIMHAEIKIGSSRLMLNDEIPAMGCKSVETFGGSPVSFYVYIENVDAAWKRAVDAGATVMMPLADMFWGDRVGVVVDPFGHKWTLAQHVSDPTPEEMKKGQEAFAARMQKKS